MPSKPRDSKRKANDDVEGIVLLEGKVRRSGEGQMRIERGGTIEEQPAGPSGRSIGGVARAQPQHTRVVKSEEDSAVIGLPLKKNPVPVERDVHTPAKSDKSDDSSSDRKMRLVWSQELHNRFLNALSHLGLKKAVPKNILGLMNVEGMTRENVASHLQKYRLYLKKNGGYTTKDKISCERLQELHEENVQRMASQEAMQQNVSFLDPQGMGGFGNFPPHFQAEIPHIPSEDTEYKPPLIVDGIPIGDPPQPVVTSAMFANPIPKPDMSPAVQEVDGGHFNPNKWKYPAFPGDTEQQEHSSIGKGEEEEYHHHHHHHHHSHLPFNAAHEEKSDDLFDDKSIDHAAQRVSDAGNDDGDGDELLVNHNNNSLHHDA